jgi:hypothetical protein
MFLANRLAPIAFKKGERRVFIAFQDLIQINRSTSRLGVTLDAGDETALSRGHGVGWASD